MITIFVYAFAQLLLETAKCIIDEVKIEPLNFPTAVVTLRLYFWSFPVRNCINGTRTSPMLQADAIFITELFVNREISTNDKFSVLLNSTETNVLTFSNG